MSREAAFLALLRWHTQGLFLWDSIEQWKQQAGPSSSDLNFAYELACGSLRMERFLDYAIKMIVKKKPSKQKERILLRLSLYQYYFLPNIPLYAINDNMVQLAKKHCHSSFAAFLNATLRQLKREKLPAIDPKDLGTFFSYPNSFVTLLLNQYGHEKTAEILEQGNTPSPLSAICYNKRVSLDKYKSIEDPTLEKVGLQMAFLDNPDPAFYIQNRTQPTLLAQLSLCLQKKPKRILDMCAAPGGKSLILHHLYPDAELVVNDTSEHKIERLSDNLRRFSCPAEILCQKGQTISSDTPFDLILVDAPCSNSGVLYKCPEARWRLSEESLIALAKTQMELLTNARSLLDKNGKIWFMTCSILSEENESLIEKACHLLGLQVDHPPFLQLPNSKGYEGGFGCQLSLKN